MFFDTHVHFSDADGENDHRTLVERARAAGVTRMLAVGGEPGLDRQAIATARAFPGTVELALGYDRQAAACMARSETTLSEAVEALRRQIGTCAAEGVPVVAIGETGLDYYYGHDTAESQKVLFKAQLALARELALPVIVHSREAEADTVALLEEHRRAWPHAPERLGVLHCFTGGPDFAERIVGCGFHISFSGIATFRNADRIRAAIPVVPEDRVLIETDTPYLAPVPHRGKPNEPAYLPHVAKAVATCLGCTVEAVAVLTAANAEKLFQRPRC
jgi:TatD DNase family protein